MSEFSCKGKRLADYLINHGSKLIRIEKGNIYIFEKMNAFMRTWLIMKETQRNVCFNS